MCPERYQALTELRGSHGEVLPRCFVLFCLQDTTHRAKALTILTPNCLVHQRVLSMKTTGHPHGPSDRQALLPPIGQRKLKTEKSESLTRTQAAAQGPTQDLHEGRWGPSCPCCHPLLSWAVTSVPLCLQRSTREGTCGRAPADAQTACQLCGGVFPSALQPHWDAWPGGARPCSPKPAETLCFVTVTFRGSVTGAVTQSRRLGDLGRESQSKQAQKHKYKRSQAICIYIFKSPGSR